MGWVSRAMALIAVVVMAPLVVGAAYEAVCDLRARRLAPPGRMIVVGGVEQHLHCIGRGAPTVILEAGAFSHSVNWALVQPGLAEATRVCAYDRAGLAWSGSRPGSVDGPTRARQLHALLNAAGERGPYVMVGHSFGGLLVREFQRQQAQDVVGVAAIDSSFPGQNAAFAEAEIAWAWHVVIADRLPSASVHVGLTRVFNRAFYRDGYPDFSPMAFQELTHFAADPGHRAAATSEMAAAADPQWAEALNAHSLGDVPLAVVSAGVRPRSWFASDADQARSAAVWASLQARLVALSTNSRRVIVDDADHNSLLGNAEHAAATRTAILWVVNEARRKAPL